MAFYRTEKIFAAVFFALASYAFPAAAGEIDDKTVAVPMAPKVWKAFPLGSVRLSEGSPFYHAQEISRAFMKDADVERMLNGIRRGAGVAEKPGYEGSNQPDGTRPLYLDHYISGISLMYAQTGDQELIARVNYIIDELDALYKNNGVCFISPAPAVESILSGNLTLAFGDEGGFPWGGSSGNAYYSIHKQMAALRDAYLYCGNKKALALLISQAEGIVAFALKANPDLFDDFLDIEHGAMNAVFADLYALTSDPRYMEVSKKFNHQKVVLNIADGKDVLYPRHANFQVATFEGTARQYQLTGDKVCKDATFNFLDIIYSSHMMSIGSNSCYERFGRPGETTKRLGFSSSETCNTYNMLKVALNAFESSGDLRHMDYYECALYNHILASQDPETGGVTYYMSTLPGGFKSYSRRFDLDGVWCCVGTGLENHSKYGQAVYFSNGNSLLVNLFIPSKLEWKGKGMVVEQKTGFPRDGFTEIKIVKSGRYSGPVYIRYPKWTAAKPRLTLNGRPVEFDAKPGGYIAVNADWKAGDSIRLELPQVFWFIPAKDDPYMMTIMRGPIAYAAALGDAGMPNDLVRNSLENDGFIPPADIPTLVADKLNPEAWIAKDGTDPLSYDASSVAVLGGRKVRLKLLPFYAIHHQRYSLYLKVYSPAEKALRDAVVFDELRPGGSMEKSHAFKDGSSSLVPASPHKEGAIVWEKSRMGRASEPGGWFSYEMKVGKNTRNYLVVTYWGGEVAGHEFDISANGKTIASENFNNDLPVTFFERIYELPDDAIDGGDKVVVRFQAREGGRAGAVYALKTTSDPFKFPNYSFYF